MVKRIKWPVVFFDTSIEGDLRAIRSAIKAADDFLAHKLTNKRERFIVRSAREQLVITIKDLPAPQRETMKYVGSQEYATLRRALEGTMTAVAVINAYAADTKTARLRAKRDFDKGRAAKARAGLTGRRLKLDEAVAEELRKAREEGKAEPSIQILTERMNKRLSELSRAARAKISKSTIRRAVKRVKSSDTEPSST